MPQSPDYLLIGHIAHDKTPTGPKLGGTVSYAGSTADALGAQVAIVTSARRDEVVLASLPARAQLHLIELANSTVFVNTYEGDKRRQVLRRPAEILTLANVPGNGAPRRLFTSRRWMTRLIRSSSAFPGSLVAATPQGWMRTWDAEGVISPKAWAHAETLFRC